MLVRRGDKWFADIRVSKPFRRLPRPSRAAIGCDRGIRNFAVDSLGRKMVYPAKIRALQQRLRVLKRQMGRQQLGSRRRRRTTQEYQRVLGAYRIRVRSWIVQCARDLLGAAQVIKLEGFRGSMPRRRDPQWTPFARLLERMARDHGRVVQYVHPAYTSKICSHCGRKTQIGKQEVYTCEHCGVTFHRDVNAAVNIERRTERRPGKPKTPYPALGAPDRALGAGAGRAQCAA